MDNKRSLFTLENAMYAALFAAALWLRLFQLNAHPLADTEAQQALVALRLVNGAAQTGLPASPGHVFFTYLSFLVFDASSATARLAPALFGAALTLAPLFYRDVLGRGAALAASALLAGSATLLAASRTADGAMITLAAFAAGLGAFRFFRKSGEHRWLAAAAVAFGAGLAGGGQFLTGAAALGLTVAVMAWTNPGERGAPRDVWRSTVGWRGWALLAGGGTALLISTVVFLYRPGLGALTGSWLAWLGDSLPSAAGRAPQMLLLFFGANEPLLLVFGGVGAVLAFRSGQRAAQWLFWFALIALTLSLVRGGREAADLAWTAAPLCGLAAWAVSEAVGAIWNTAPESRPILAAQMAVIVILLTFGLMNSASFAEKVRVDPLLTQEQVTYSGYVIPVSPVAYLVMSAVALTLAALTTYLVAMGWERRTAVHGLALAVAAVLAAIGLRSAWGLTQLRAASPVELWRERAAADDLNRLVQSVSVTSDYAVGNEHDVEITVQADPDGALAWAFRDFPHARFTDALDAVVTSPVVVAPAAERNPSLGSAYVGQDFVAYQTWQPELSWTEWIGWLAFRRAPVDSEKVILWVRQDIQQLQGAQ